MAWSIVRCLTCALHVAPDVALPPCPPLCPPWCPRGRFHLGFHLVGVGAPRLWATPTELRKRSLNHCSTMFHADEPGDLDPRTDDSVLLQKSKYMYPRSHRHDVTISVIHVQKQVKSRHEQQRLRRSVRSFRSVQSQIRQILPERRAPTPAVSPSPGGIHGPSRHPLHGLARSSRVLRRCHRHTCCQHTRRLILGRRRLVYRRVCGDNPPNAVGGRCGRA